MSEKAPDGRGHPDEIAWIKTLPEGGASGYLKGLYGGFLKQWGWVPNILESTSIRSGAIRGWVSLFHTLMYGESGLSRSRREMIAVGVPAAHRCHY